MRLLTSLLCLALVCSLAAEDWEDARIGMVFSQADVSIDLPNGPVDDGWDSYTHLHVDLLSAKGSGYGQVFGLSGIYRDGEVDCDRERFSQESYALRLFGGLALFPGDAFLIEATPFIGGGLATGEIASANLGTADDDAWFWEYGASVQASYAFADTVIVGAGVHYTHGEYDYDIFDRDRELEEDGFSFGLFLGVRLQ